MVNSGITDNLILVNLSRNYPDLINNETIHSLKYIYSIMPPTIPFITYYEFRFNKEQSDVDISYGYTIDQFQELVSSRKTTDSAWERTTKVILEILTPESKLSDVIDHIGFEYDSSTVTINQFPGLWLGFSKKFKRQAIFEIMETCYNLLMVDKKNFKAIDLFINKLHKSVSISYMAFLVSRDESFTRLSLTFSNADYICDTLKLLEGNLLSDDMVWLINIILDINSLFPGCKICLQVNTHDGVTFSGIEFFPDENSVILFFNYLIKKIHTKAYCDSLKVNSFLKITEENCKTMFLPSHVKLSYNNGFSAKGYIYQSNDHSLHTLRMKKNEIKISCNGCMHN